MVFYVAGCWLFGLVWIGILSEVSKAESPRLVALARAVFVAGVAIMLGVTAVIVASANSNPDARLHPSRTGVWGYSLGCAIPVTLLALLATRRAFARQLALAAAIVPVIALLALEAAAFRPAGAKLDGLAQTAHTHHLLVVAALIVAVAALAAVAAIPKRGPEPVPYSRGA